MTFESACLKDDDDVFLRVVQGFLAKCFRLAVIEAQLPASPAFGLHALAGRRRMVLGLGSWDVYAFLISLGREGGRKGGCTMQCNVKRSETKRFDVQMTKMID